MQSHRRALRARPDQPSTTPPTWAAARAARRAAAASSWARRRRRRWSPRRSGWRCRTARSRRRASRSGWTWRGVRRARCVRLHAARMPLSAILTPAALENAMLRARGVRRVDEPAAAHPGAGARGRAARVRRSTTGSAINRATPRLVDALPNGPRNHPTVQVFMAGGVPEVMLHLRRMGAAEHRRADGDGREAGRGARLVGGERPAPRGARAAEDRRTASIPTRVIMSADAARAAGLTSTVVFPVGQRRARRARS